MTSKMLISKPFKKQTLAEKVADSIEELIVGGTLKGGDALPTEPEISQQFGVSRAVVRDATRMLAAKGLVEARHGKGVFVTHTQTEAFGAALLLALRRMGASNWDVAQFEQLLYPEVVTLAATNATEADVHKIQAAADDYLKRHGELAEVGLPEIDSKKYQAFRQTWDNFIQAVFDATHNQVLTLLARPLIGLHAMRNWEGLPVSITTQETQFITTVIDLIKSSDPEHVRRQMGALMALPPEAVAAMRQTEVAAPVHIVLNSEDR